MADETTNPAASTGEPGTPSTGRRRTPRRAASRPAGAPDPSTLTFSSSASHPAREPEQQVDVLAAFGLGDGQRPAATEDGGEKSEKLAKKKAAKSAKSKDAPAPSQADAQPEADIPAATTADAEKPARKRAKGTSAAKDNESGDGRSAPKRTSRKKAETAPADADVAESSEPAAEAAETSEESAPPKRARRSRAKKTAEVAEPADAADAVEGAGAAPEESETPEATTEDEVEDAEAEETEAEEQDLHLPATALLFQAPAATPRRRRRATRAAKAADAAEEQAEETSAEGADDSTDATAGSTDDAETESAQTDSAEDAENDDNDSQEGSGSSSRRRRRRGGRGRRRSSENGDESGSGQAEGEQPGTDEPTPAEGTTDSADADSEDGTGTRRRRRRRGKRGEDDGGARAARDEVTALRGSTRLEAKRLRRREGRDAGRRRQIITEAEFLARRESVQRDMVVRETEGMTQIAVLEDGVLVEHYVARAQQTSMVGNVYLGRVQNVLPSMEAAFVDLGRGRNAVLYAGEVNWDAAGLEGQPRRIEQALKSGDQILVQVTKDPIGHKGARLTSQITLAGRYLVLVPSGAMTGISRKLPDTERARLKKLLKEIVPEGQGVIVRTAAEGASEEELRRDVERLTSEWADIQARTQGKRVSAPALLKGEPELALRVVRDVFNEDFSSLTVAGAGAWSTISEYVDAVAPDLAERLHHWTSAEDVFASKRIDEQLAKGMDRKVWLPSGGSLVIDRTEAMTVVDVNTGKFTGSGGTLEETVTRNNLEAAEEIVRQLRLRDIGGIIVIDFIDMVLESNRDLVLRRLIECLGRDRTRHQVAEVTSLGLVQMTRKRVGQGLVEAFSTPCEHCHGRGFTVDSRPHDHVELEVASDDDGPRVGRRRGGRTRGGSGTNGASNGSNGSNGNGSGTNGSGGAQAPADDAARAAVKATLAQIAAAAQQAHHAHDDVEGATEDSVGAPGQDDGADEVPSVAEVPAEATSRPARRKRSARRASRSDVTLEGLVDDLDVSAGAAGDELVVRAPAGPVISQAERLAALAALEASLPGAVSEAVEQAEAADETEAADEAENEQAVAEAEAGVEEVLEAEIVEETQAEPEVIEGEVVDPQLLEPPTAD